MSSVFCLLTGLDPKFIIGLHKLYTEEKLLHRDISIGNLAYEIVNGKPRIIILDFELATRVDDEARTDEVRTGTAPFMAREVLKGFKSGYRHTLNHDLESVYYISGWHIAGYRGYELPIIDNVKSDPFRDWKYGTYQEMCQAKEDHINTRPSHNIFEKYQDPDDKSDAIDNLNIIRSYYLNRHKIVGSLDHDLDEFKEIHAAGRQADKYGLRGKERNEFVQKKIRELREENERQKITNAISFREWMIGGAFLRQEDIDCDCDSCNDEIAKTFRSSESDEINQ